MNGAEDGVPRRVLLTTDAVGGVWRYTADLARGLRDGGVRPVVALLGPPPAPPQRAAMAAQAEIVETGLPLDWLAPDEPALADAAAALARLAGDVGADLVHLHAPAYAGYAAWPAPVAAVAHSCLATWWRAVRRAPLPADFAWRVAATGRGLRAADSVLAPSRALADALRREYGLTRDIAVVHNGSDAPLSVGGGRDRAVLTAGRLWDEGKNAALLDRIAPALDAPVFAAGPTAGPNGAAIRLDRLTLLGTLDTAALQRRVAATAIYAAPALYEPFGLGVLEAARGGMALVLSDIPSFRELWDGAALFADAASDAAMAQAIARLLADPALTARQAARAQQRARRFTLAAMVAGTLAAHRRVAALDPAA